MRKFLGELFGGGGGPKPAEIGGKISDAMRENKLPKISGAEFGKPKKYEEIQPAFTALAFEAKNSKFPEATEVLEGAKAALQEMGRGMNIAANEKIVEGAMREAKNILSGVITPEFSQAEYQKAVVFEQQQKENEHKQKIDAWKNILRMGDGEGLSESDLARMAEAKVNGEDLDDTLQDEGGESKAA